MKFRAHPLVVAAALGLLGPAAVIDPSGDERDEEEAREGGSEDESREGYVIQLSEKEGWAFGPLVAPPADAFDAVADLWAALDDDRTT